MSDESKLGLVAGVLAVIGVAVFSFPKDPPKEQVNKPASAAVAPAPSPPAVVPGK